MEIKALKCNQCGQVIYPERKFCPTCRSTDLKDTLLPSKGSIFSYTTIHYPLDNYPNPPYHIGLVQVDKVGILVIARLEIQNSENIEIGKRVNLDIKTYPESGDLPILVASPDEAS